MNSIDQNVFSLDFQNYLKGYGKSNERRTTRVSCGSGIQCAYIVNEKNLMNQWFLFGNACAMVLMLATIRVNVILAHSSCCESIDNQFHIKRIHFAFPNEGKTLNTVHRTNSTEMITEYFQCKNKNTTNEGLYICYNNVFN